MRAEEWLYEKVWKDMNFSISSSILDQAKEMEKKQLNDAYNTDRPNLTCYEENTAFTEYYNETFNNED